MEVGREKNLELLYLAFQLTAFIASHRAGNHRPWNSTSSTKCLLGRNKDI